MSAISRAIALVNDSSWNFILVHEATFIKKIHRRVDCSILRYVTVLFTRRWEPLQFPFIALILETREKRDVL